jgi:hypothetical protein
MRECDAKSQGRAFQLLSGAFSLTLVVFAPLMIVVAATAAHGIWVEGKHDPKLGDEWRNLWCVLLIYSWLLSIPCGILFLGNATSTLIARRKCSTGLVVIGALFTLLAGSWIILGVLLTYGSCSKSLPA